MKIRRCIYLLVFLVITLLNQTNVFAQIEKKISNFSLRNVNNKQVSLSDYPSAKGFIIIFTCNHCPFAQLYSGRLNALNKKYSALGVPLIAINSMDSVLYKDETFDLMKIKSKKNKFNFCYLQDASQMVGKDFHATHTPQSFVVWKESGKWIVKYEGAIDDNGEHAKLAHSFIAKAVDELLAGKVVSRPVTESFGCKIFYRKG
jgi:alkyl hydroperoxide reductase subunit AhpC